MNTYAFLVSICLVAINEAGKYNSGVVKKGGIGYGGIERSIGGVNVQTGFEGRTFRRGGAFQEGFEGEVTGQEGFGGITGREFGVVGGQRGVRRGLVREGILRGVSGQTGFGGEFGVGAGGVDITSGVRGVAVRPGIEVLAGVKGVVGQPGLGVSTGVRGVARQAGLEDILTGRTTFGERVSGQTGFGVGLSGRTIEQGGIVGGVSGRTEFGGVGGPSRIIKKSGYGIPEPQY